MLQKTKVEKKFGFWYFVKSSLYLNAAYGMSMYFHTVPEKPTAMLKVEKSEDFK